jgi:hypothetical protein
MMEDTDFPIISASSFYGTRYTNLSAAVADIDSFERSGEVDVVILPLAAVDSQTDEEDIDEDDIQGKESLPSVIPGEAEVRWQESDNDFEDSHSEDDVPLSVRFSRNKSLRTSRAKTPKKTEPKWTDQNVNINMNVTTSSFERQSILKSELEGLNPVEVFEKIIYDDVVSVMWNNRICTRHRKTIMFFFVSKTDTRVFLGVRLLSGYHKLPRERLYWGLDEDFHVPLVSESMSRNRFLDIKKYIHLTDNNNIDKADKMATHVFAQSKFQTMGDLS